MLLPIKDVVYSYVVENEQSQITDFLSFYILNSSVLGNPKHDHVNAAYLYYYVPKGMGQDPERLSSVIHDTLVFAKEVLIFN